MQEITSTVTILTKLQLIYRPSRKSLQ